MMQQLLPESFLLAMGWTLIHFLWQGAAISALLLIVNRILSRRAARYRYAASCIAMLFMLAAPVMTFALLSAPGEHPALPTISVAAQSNIRMEPLTPPGWPAAEVPLLRFFPWLTSLWFAGVAVMSIRTLGGWIYAIRLKQRFTHPLPDSWQQYVTSLCGRIRISRPVRILESAVIQAPMVIGWLRPVILTPASALTGLTPRQLEAILLHELAHIRRHDYLVNLLQTVVEILLFYHPAVWWVSHQIRNERENCCDDLTVDVCGDRIAYARALAELEALRGLSPRLAMAADGGSLLARIQRIAGRTPQPSNNTGSWIAGMMVLATVLILAAGAGIPLSPDNAASPSAPRISLVAAPQPPDVEGEVSAPEPPVPPEHLEIAAPRAPKAPPSRPGFIEDLASLGYADLSVDEIIRMKDHGVTPEFIRELRVLGYDHRSVQQLIRMSDHGVKAHFIGGMQGQGFPALPPEELIRTKDHGIDANFMRGIRSLGYKDLSTADFVKLKDHGVTRAYVAAIRSAGYAGVPADQLIRLRDHGVDAGFIKRAEARGFSNLSIDQLIRLRDSNVLEETVPEENHESNR